MEKITITFNDIVDIEFDGINSGDAPDYSDAFIASAWNKEANRPCTDAELDYIQDNYQTEVYEALTNQLN